MYVKQLLFQRKRAGIFSIKKIFFYSDTTNRSASEEDGQTQKSDHKRKDKEEEKLISISSLFLDFSSYRPLGQNAYTVKKCLFL